VALTPVTVAINRDTNPDTLMVLLLVAAAYAFTRPVQQPLAAAKATRWLMLAALFLGLGFITKMLQAWIVVPAFALAYLAGSTAPVRRRILDLLGAGAVLLWARRSPWRRRAGRWPLSPTSSTATLRSSEWAASAARTLLQPSARSPSGSRRASCGSSSRATAYGWGPGLNGLPGVNGWGRGGAAASRGYPPSAPSGCSSTALRAIPLPTAVRHPPNPAARWDQPIAARCSTTANPV
jgi:hypothetical protein